MKERNSSLIRTGTMVGAVLGGVAFLIFGLVPAFHYGGFATLMLLGKLAGGPVEATLGVRLILVLGVLLGILCLGFLSLVLGSVAGTAAAYVVQLLSAAGHKEAAVQGAENNRR